MKILLFGGTKEGRELAEWLDERGACEVIACSATEYGGELVSELEHVQTRVGPLSDRDKELLAEDDELACIVDATHPFATHVTESIADLAQRHDVPVVRVVREDVPCESYTQVSDVAEAASYVATLPGNILLTTGSKNLDAFVGAIPDFKERLFVRVLPITDSVAHAHALGIPTSHIVAMQGPFSYELNCMLMLELLIDVMVTKASGAAGGFPEKLMAARACGVEAVVIGRPVEESGVTLAEAKRELETIYGA